ncbi:LysR family transcriptional regulator [Bradyrhizobium elkanii]|uniref:LysR family transcriptional regulator n=1 Tax=Bradyrhizobium elkanii TaxID=29448 RepID=UPI002225D063|nr:LysR family transcriptional regulator [Bradyrhizobium elkanii]MCW2109517.1 DNA-binding transcriptional LysR family regulator [Bradyrhizobium elkanii]
MPLNELRRLDLNLLVVLQTVLETRNVTAAARRLNMSQPAVSRALSRLRVLFDDQLFVKGPKGVIPTPRAEGLSDLVARLLSEISGAVARPAFDPASSTRVFRIATTDYGALAVLIPVIAALVAEAPGIGLDIVPVNASSFHDLATGNVDFALYSDDPTPANLRRMFLFEEGYVTLVRKDGAAAASALNGRMAMADFLDRGHILVNVAGGRSGVVDDALAERGEARHVAVSLPYFSAAGVLAARTDLLLTLPSRAAVGMSGELGLVMLEPPVSLPTFTYHLLWHPRHDADPGAVWFRNRIGEAVRLEDRAVAIRD